MRAEVHAAPDAAPDTATLTRLGPPVAGFIVYGEPGAQGSKNKGAHGQLYESSKKVRPWRAAVRDAFLAVAGRWWVPLEGAIVLDTVFTVARPKSEPKRIRTFPCRQPDLDKLQRSTNDGLTEAGLWRNDGQVVGYRRLFSFYTGDLDPDALNRPGAVIRAWQAPKEPM